MIKTFDTLEQNEQQEITRYFELDEQIKALKKEQEELKAKLFTNLNNTSIFNSEINMTYKITTTVSKRTSYDTEKMVEVLGEETMNKFKVEKDIETKSIKLVKGVK